MGARYYELGIVLCIGVNEALNFGIRMRHIG